jgi:hypothetical protein
MKQWLILAGLLALSLPAVGQDVSWLLDEAPVVSMVLVKTLEKTPAFSAKVEINVSGKADPSPSAATGTIESQGGNLRWEAKLGDIRSAQLSQNARSVVRQINGEQFLVLTRSDQKANYLVLTGAQAYLEQPLPPMRLSSANSQAATERIDGRICSRERLRAVQSGGTTNEVVVWRAKDLKNLPVQIQFTDSGETVLVRFRDISVRAISTLRFQVPAGLAKYSSVEDLVQSVVVERVKKRIGL